MDSTPHVNVPRDRLGRALQRPRVLVIGGRRADQLATARNLGLHVTYVQRKAKLTSEQLRHCDQALMLNYDDIALLVSVVRAFHQVVPFRYAYSVAESGTVPAAHVVEALGLDGNSLRTSRLLHDKWLMRKRLAEVGLSVVPARLGSAASDIAEFASSYGLPLIVKPTDAAGSMHVKLVESSADISAIAALFGQLGLQHFLIEQFLPGPEFSVEAVTLDNKHVPVAVTEKQVLPNFVEVGHVVPARIPAVVANEVVQLVVRFLDAVGVRHGPTHTEVKLTPDGPRVVESHDRLGGDRIPDLVKEAYGIDLLAASVSAGVGWPVRLPQAPPRKAAAIGFFVPEPGFVRAIEGVEAARRLPGVVRLRLEVGVGDRVHAIESSADRPGYVVVTAESPDSALERCRRVLDEVLIVTEPVL